MIEIVVANPAQKGERYEFPSLPIEIGREKPRELPRVEVRDLYTSRHQVLVDNAAAGQLRIENITDSPDKKGLVWLANGVTLGKGENVIVEPPVRLFFGKTTADISRSDKVPGDQGVYETIQRSFLVGSSSLENTLSSHASASAQDLAQWFESLLTVQRAAAGSDEFYQEAAKAVVDRIGLDRGLVILNEPGGWTARAAHSRHPDDHRMFSRTTCDKAARDKTTIFHSGGVVSDFGSLANVQSLVASPVFDEQETVIGIVYGSRDIRPSLTHSGVRPLEAQFVQVIAGMVSAGLIRAAREAEAARMRVQFEGFFSKPLAQALERDRRLLDARKRELTMLFLDLRGFSKIAEEASESAYRFLSECLNSFTSTVMKYHGVVIDYYGDGFAAMWNAPLDQPNHAELAVEAALEIRDIIPLFNDKYIDLLQGKVAVGIGIHTGDAVVGNSGSDARLKYGPRGHSVNTTSRVESANKIVGTMCLLTGATRAKLKGNVPLRRICQARLAGMSDAVELFELGKREPSDKWRRLCSDYEEALAQYERGKYAECLRSCARIVAGDTDDPTTHWLLQNAGKRRGESDATPDPIFRFEKG